MQHQRRRRLNSWWCPWFVSGRHQVCLFYTRRGKQIGDSSPLRAEKGKRTREETTRRGHTRPRTHKRMVSQKARHSTPLHSKKMRKPERSKPGETNRSRSIGRHQTWPVTPGVSLFHTRRGKQNGDSSPLRAEKGKKTREETTRRGRQEVVLQPKLWETAVRNHIMWPVREEIFAWFTEKGCNMQRFW